MSDQLQSPSPLTDILKIADDRAKIDALTPNNKFSDIFNGAKVHGKIAENQSISAPIVIEQQQLDIRIRSQMTAKDAITFEIQEMNHRHEQRLTSLNLEHAENVARLLETQKNIDLAVRVLKAAQNMLLRGIENE